MPENLGIESTKKFVIEALSVIVMLVAIVKGKMDWSGRIFKVMEIMAKITQIVKEIFPIALLEIKDLDPDERKELEQLFITEFDIKDDNLERIIETSIILLEKIFFIAKDVIAYLKAKPSNKQVLTE